MHTDISVISFSNIGWCLSNLNKFRYFFKWTFITIWFSPLTIFSCSSSFLFFLDNLSIDMNQCVIVWCQRVSKITTDGRHAYLFRAGWPVGTAWAWLGSAQHWFTITWVISVDWKNNKKFFLSWNTVKKNKKKQNWTYSVVSLSVSDRKMQFGKI